MRNYVIAAILVISGSIGFAIALNMSKPNSKAMTSTDSTMQMMGSEKMQSADKMGQDSMAPQMTSGGMSQQGAMMDKGSNTMGQEMARDDNGPKMRDEKNKMKPAMMKEKMDSDGRPEAN